MFRFLALSLLFATTLVFGATPDVITIAHVANFSSESQASISQLNSAYSDAAKMALGEFEKKFEKYHVEVRLLDLDHGPKDSDGAKLAEQAVKSDAVGVLGYYESGKALLAAPVLIAAGMQMVTPTSSAVKLNELGPLVRTLSISNRQMAQQMVRIAKVKLKVKKALVVTESDCAFCVDLESELEAALIKKEVKFTKLNFPSTELNTDGVVKAAMAEHYDAVILPTQEMVAARLIKNLLKAGVKIPYVGGDGWGASDSTAFFDVVKDNKFQAYVVGHWDPGRTTPLGRKFAKHWTSRFYRNPTNDWAMVYEGTRFVLENILEMLKVKTPVTRVSFAKKISAAKKYEGMVSRFVFEGPGSPPSRSVVILKSNNKKKRFDPLETVWVSAADSK